MDTANGIADQGLDHVVPLPSLDYFRDRSYWSVICIFRFPSPALIPTAISTIRAALEAMAAQNAATTGYIRLNEKKLLELHYKEGVPFVDRLKIRHLTNTDEFCHKYADMTAASMPPEVWKDELFAPFDIGLAAQLDTSDGVPTIGVQVTWIEGGMVVCWRVHHSWTDMRGFLANVETPFRAALDAISRETAAETFAESIDRWVERLAEVGFVAAVKAYATSPAVGKRRTHREYDNLRGNVYNQAEKRASNLRPGFDLTSLKRKPNANCTPIPLQVITPGRFARPYRTAKPTTNIFIFSSHNLHSIKSHIHTLIRRDPLRYLTVEQRKQNYGEKITSNIVLEALMWTHITETRSTRPDAEFGGPSVDVDAVSTLAAVVSVGGKLCLSSDYPGNAIYVGRASLPIKKLQSENDQDYRISGSLITTAVLARAAIAIVASIEMLTAASVQTTLVCITTLPAERRVQISIDHYIDFNNATDLYVTSWSKFGISGQTIPGAAKGPEYQRKLATNVDGAMCVLPKMSETAPWEVQVNLRADDMARLRAELWKYTERVVGGNHLAVI